MATSVQAQESSLTLAQLVTPSTVFRSQDETVLFGLHWFIEFETLEDLFTHIDAQCGRWEFDSAEQRKAFGDDLLRRGTESRVISMHYELPREILVTHTAEELAEFLKLERFREVIHSTEGTRLLHFLNDGTSPDILIPVYVGMLEEIRQLALREPGAQ